MTSYRPRLVVAALRGGSGKTTIAVSLAAAFSKRGQVTVPFKKGPDYIDAAWLARAASSPGYNLDTFLIGREGVLDSFTRRTGENKLALIEGNRGLYDGMNDVGEHSTAELAKLLCAPVVLVVDCTKVTRTAAAMVLGCQRLDPAVNIRGVILNLVGGERHGNLAKRTIEECCGIPVLGIIPRMAEAPFSQRHLGLIPPQELGQIPPVLDRLRDLAENFLEVEGLLKMAHEAPPWRPQAASFPPKRAKRAAGEVTIGIIRDEAFHFYYEENIEALADGGAKLVVIDALNSVALPPLDALYIGGGFPEAYADRLTQNLSLRRSIRDAIHDGLPVYAECGGLIYLGESLTIGTRTYPMVGALSVSFTMEKRPQGHGYTEMAVTEPNPFFPVGLKLRGHEFHYCIIRDDKKKTIPTAFQVQRGVGFGDGRDGLVHKNVLAAFSHFHAAGTPEWAEGLLARARLFRSG